MTRLLPLSVYLLFFSACMFHKSAGKTRKQAIIEIGMTHDSARAALDDRSEVIVAEFNRHSGHMVAYQYTRYGKAGLKQPKIVLYFLNDTLYRKSEPEDLEEGARLAMKARKQYFIDRAADQKEREEREAYRAEQDKRKEEQAARREEMRSKHTERHESEQKHEHRGLFGKKKHKDDDKNDEKE